MKKAISYLAAFLAILAVSATLSGCAEDSSGRGFVPVSSGPTTLPPAPKPPQPGTPSQPPAPSGGNTGSNNSGGSFTPATPAVSVQLVNLKSPWETSLYRTVGDNNDDAVMLALKVTANRDNIPLTALTLRMSATPTSARLTDSSWNHVGTVSHSPFTGYLDVAPVGTALAVLNKKGDSTTLYLRANMSGHEGKTVFTTGVWLDFEPNGISHYVSLYGLTDIVNVVETPRAAIAAVSSLVRVASDKTGEVLAAEVELSNNSTKYALELNNLQTWINSGQDVEMRLEDENNVVLAKAQPNSWVQNNVCLRYFVPQTGTCRLLPGESVRLRVFLKGSNLVSNRFELQVVSAFVQSDNGQSASVDGVRNTSNWQFETLATDFQSSFGGPVEAFSIAQVSTGTIANVGSVVVAKVEITPANALATHTLDQFQVSSLTSGSLPRTFRVLVNGTPQASFTLTDWTTPATVTLNGVTLTPGQTTTIEIEMEVLGTDTGKSVLLNLWDFQSDSFEDSGHYISQGILLG